MTRVVITRAGDWDIPAKYLSAYGVKLVEFARDKGFEVVDLYNDQQPPARLLAFEAEMDNKPDILIACGHGNPTSITGMDLEVLMKQGVNDDLASGVKSYFWACLCAHQLGPSMVEKSCPEFYGYGSDWSFVYHPDFKDKPLEDPYARAFFDAGLTTGYGVLLGKDPKTIFDETIARYDYWWDYWIRQNDPMADDILTWLNWDKSNFMAITKAGIYESAPATLNSVLGLAVPLGIAGALIFLLSRK